MAVVENILNHYCRTENENANCYFFQSLVFFLELLNFSIFAVNNLLIWANTIEHKLSKTYISWIYYYEQIKLFNNSMLMKQFSFALKQCQKMITYSENSIFICI